MDSHPSPAPSTPDCKEQNMDAHVVTFVPPTPKLKEPAIDHQASFPTITAPPTCDSSEPAGNRKKQDHITYAIISAPTAFKLKSQTENVEERNIDSEVVIFDPPALNMSSSTIASSVTDVQTTRDVMAQSTKPHTSARTSLTLDSSIRDLFEHLLGGRNGLRKYRKKQKPKTGHSVLSKLEYGIDQLVAGGKIPLNEFFKPRPVAKLLEPLTGGSLYKNEQAFATIEREHAGRLGKYVIARAKYYDNKGRSNFANGIFSSVDERNKAIAARRR